MNVVHGCGDIATRVRLLGVTGNESPGKQMMPGLPATQLTSTLRTLHRRNLMSRHQRLVVAIFGRRGQAMELCQQFPRLRHHNQYRPMLGRSRHASELQELSGRIDDILLLWCEPRLVPCQQNVDSRSPPAQCAGTSPVVFRLSDSFLSNHPVSHKAKIFNVIAEARAIEARVSHMIPSSILILANSHQ